MKQVFKEGIHLIKIRNILFCLILLSSAVKFTNYFKGNIDVHLLLMDYFLQDNNLESR